jgi:FHS family L-fucose permease-like MFS transporter
MTNPALATPKTSQPSIYSTSLVLLTSLFFMWGLITSLNDILVPHLKAIFTLSYVQAMLVQFCFFGAYFVASFPAGYLVERIGYRRGIVGGLFVAGLGCLGFYPAASAESYALFLSSLFVLASGITLLQVAANPCVALLGTPETSASRLNLTQAFNSLGTTIGPLLGASLILSEAAPGSTSVTREIQTVQTPYVVLAALLCAMAAGFSRFKLPAIGDDRKDAASASTAHAPESVWKQPHLVLGVIAIFLYVGAEVAIGSFLVNFMAQPEIAGLSESDAGRRLSFYWGGAMVGRFIGSWVLSHVRAGRVLAANALGAILLLVLTVSVRGHVGMWSVLAVGLCNSIMFPTIFTLAIADLGPRTGEGSGALCMAIVGGALVPVLMGFVADRVGLTPAFLVPLVCYAYIAHYGFRGHALR